MPDGKCMKEVYAKTLAGLIGFSRQPACTLPRIDDECEVYVYNTPPQAKKSMAPLLSEKLYTYREKVRINRPDKCVYLFLASGYPQVWDILTTEGTDRGESMSAAICRRWCAVIPRERR